MNKNALCASIGAGALFCSPVHALTISGTGVFDVIGNIGNGIDTLGSGFFALRRDVVLDFEFTAFGHTWDEIDIRRHCDCHSEPPDVLLSVGFHFCDITAGNGWDFAWDLFHPNSGIVYDFDGIPFAGTEESGQAHLAGPIDVRVDIPASGTLPLLALEPAQLPSHGARAGLEPAGGGKGHNC
jgi:hypothetical protein